jgi:hypothetical protein
VSIFAVAFVPRNKFERIWIRILIFHPDPDPGGKSFADPDPKLCFTGSIRYCGRQKSEARQKKVSVFCLLTIFYRIDAAELRTIGKAGCMNINKMASVFIFYTLLIKWHQF